MPYYNNRRNGTRYGTRYGRTSFSRGRRRSKYTQAEKIAFRMGQEQRVKKSIASSQPSRVQTAYHKGYAGSPQSSREPLF